MKFDKKLYKDTENKKISGVCAGLAEYIDVDTNIVRLLVLGAAIFSGILPILVVYIVAAVILPEKKSKDEIEVEAKVKTDAKNS